MERSRTFSTLSLIPWEITCFIFVPCTVVVSSLPSLTYWILPPHPLFWTNSNELMKCCVWLLSDEAMDFLFDIEFFECDPVTRVDQDTPLHIAVRYANEKDIHLGLAMVKMMCEAGCDPRVKNKNGLKPVDMTIPQYKEVKVVLQKAEYILNEGMQPGSSTNGHNFDDDDDDDNPYHNSASESE